MNSVTGVIVLLVLIVGSLSIVGFANRVQNRNRLLRQKLHRMKLRIDELEEICTNVEPLLESILVPKLINEEVLDLIRGVKQLDPNTTSIDVKQEHTNALAEKFGAGQRSQPFYRILASDVEIVRHKHHLNEAGRVVRRHHALGRLQNTEADSYIRELAWAHLMVDVVSLVAQGHKAVNRDDPMAAYGCYRRAQNLVMTSLLPDDRRHRVIREIGEILEGKRLALETDLMPEVEYNPADKPRFNNLNPADLNLNAVMSPGGG